MAHIIIKLEATAAQTYLCMLNVMSEEEVPANIEFQTMIKDLKDKIHAGFMDMPQREFNQLFPDKGL